MDCLAATYEWKTASASTQAAANAATSSKSCHPNQSSAEREVQQLKAKAELALLRDRVRKASVVWLGEPQSRKPTAAPIRFDWQVQAKELVRRLCYWHQTSALSLVGVTPCLAELTREHRRQEGTSREPPASKNTLTLVVWNLATIVQGKLRLWEACVKAKTEKAFDGVIVIRVSDLVPIWSWEADILRHRPELTNLCDRMLSTELYHYRQRCGQLTKREKNGVAQSQALHLNGSEPSSTKPLKQHPSSLARSRSTAEMSSGTTTKKRKVFAGETFCVSGAFTISQKAMLSLISDNGGTVAPTFTRLCTFVVAESIGSQKTRRAQASGIPIVTEDWIRASIADGKPSTDPSLFLSAGKRAASSKTIRHIHEDVDTEEEEEDSSYVDESGDESEDSEESDIDAGLENSANESNDGESDSAEDSNDGSTDSSDGEDEEEVFVKPIAKHQRNGSKSSVAIVQPMLRQNTRMVLAPVSHASHGGRS